MEPNDDVWDFARSDSAYFNPYSLTPIGTLYSIMGSNDPVGFQTPWLACSNPFQCYWDPAEDSIYSKDYVMTTVNRYKSVTKYWEVANEIESAKPPQGLVSTAAKRDFLRYNYRWIKQADPTAQVILPGLVGTCCTFPITNSFRWLRDMLQIGAGDYFDIMNYHDYNAWWTLPAHYDSIQNILSQYGLTKPIWNTETSISSLNISTITPKYSSPEEQAADVWRRFCLLWGKGAEVVLWHSNWSSNDVNAWGEFGLVSNNGRKKKSFHAFKLLNEKISDFSSVEIISLGNVTESNTSGGEGVWVIHFVSNGRKKWVIWSPDSKPYTLTGIETNQIRITEVVPYELTNGGENALFESEVFAVDENSFTFHALSSLPILVEEESEVTGVENQKADSYDFVIYPNPAIEDVKVDINYPGQGAEIVMSNPSGYKVLKQRASERTVRLSVGHLPKGIYFVTVQIGDRVLTRKLVLL